MKCPICGKEVTLENKQVGVAENGEPILNQYAICRDCKKQWNLDKQRAKKAAAKAKAPAAKTQEDKAGFTKAATAKSPATKPQADKTPAAKATVAKPQTDKAAPTAKAPAAKPQTDKAAPTAKAPAAKSQTDKAPAAKAPTAKPQAAKAPAQATVSQAEKAEPVTRPIPQKKVREAALVEESDAAKDVEQNASNVPAKKVPAKRPVRKDADSTSEARRTRKADADSGSEARRTRKAGTDSESEERRVRKTDLSPAERGTKKSETSARKKPARKPAADSAENTDTKKTAADSQTYGNIPPEKVRAKRALAVKKGYEDMLASDPKSAATKKRAEAAKNAAKSIKENTKKRHADEDYEEESFDDLPRFRVLRVILGIFSLAAGAYFGYTGFQTSGLPYYVLAGCMLVSGLLLLILQMSNTLFTYLIPMMLYTAGGVFAFLERDDDPILLYTSIVSVVLGIIFLVLAFSSRKDEDYDGYEEEDDEDEDDYDDWDD